MRYNPNTILIETEGKSISCIAWVTVNYFDALFLNTYHIYLMTIVV